MKEYVKDNGALTHQVPKVKVYESIDDMEAALENGDIAEGEIVASKFVDGAADVLSVVEELTTEVNTINSEIPDDTNAIDNTLVNQAMLTCAVSGVINVYCENCCICSIQPGGTGLYLDEVAFDSTALVNRVSALEGNRVCCCDLATYAQTVTDSLNCKVSCSDYDTCVDAIDSAIDCRVCCSDYDSYTTCVDNRLATIENTTIPDLCTCVSCVQADISTINTCVSCLNDCTACLNSDLSTASTCISCINNDISTLETQVCTISETLDDPTSGLTSAVTSLQSCVSCLVKCCDLAACGYTACLGTVTAVCQGTCCYTPTNGVVTIPEADMSRVTALESCPGLNCTGTVVASDLTSFINASCAGTIADNCIANHAGVDCTGTVVVSDISDFITMNDVTACGYTTCEGTVKSVNGCTPDASGDVTITLPTYTLNGDVLTITI